MILNIKRFYRNLMLILHSNVLFILHMVCFQGFCRASPRLQTESLKTPHFNLQSSKSDFFFKVDYYRFKELFNLDETWYGVTPV